MVWSVKGGTFMEHKTKRLITFALLPILFSLFMGLFTSCVTVNYSEAGDGDGTVVEEVEETQVADDDDDD